MSPSQYGILEMTNKIEEQDFKSVHGDGQSVVLIKMAIHAKIFISEIVEKEQRS